MTNQTVIDRLVLRHEIEQFFIIEAELLDTRQFNAWLDLLADDIRYWMPIASNRQHGKWDGEYTREGQDLNWLDEGKFELEQRVRQIETGLHWAEEPVSRTTHMFSNLQVTQADGDMIDTQCRFLVYRNRTETETNFFVGKRHDRLRRGKDGFQLSVRKIFLDQSVLLAKNLTVFF